VRGFRDNTLGPVDETANYRQPLGGAFKTVATAEVIFPTPFVKENDNTTRLSWFLDVGNVFKDYNAFKASDLRASTGLSFQWRAPIGPIIVSVSKPLRKQDGDETETIQFTFGPQF
jgi:outer membrane protein insertion porin family